MSVKRSQFYPGMMCHTYYLCQVILMFQVHRYHSVTDAVFIHHKKNASYSNSLLFLTSQRARQDMLLLKTDCNPGLKAFKWNAII